MKVNSTRVTLSVNNIVPVNHVAMTTVHEVKVKPKSVMMTTTQVTTTETSPAAVMQGKLFFITNNVSTMLKCYWYSLLESF